MNTSAEEMPWPARGPHRGKQTRGRAVLKRGVAIAAVAGLFGLAGYAVALMAPALYRAETRILLEAGAVADQAALLTSHDLARRVAERHGLAARPEFVAAPRSPLDAVLTAVGIGRDPSRVAAEERVLDTFADRLSVRSEIDGRVLVVGFEARDQQLASAVANSLADEFVVLSADASVRPDAGSLPKARIMARAAPPAEPSFPPVLTIAAGSALGGLLLSVGGLGIAAHSTRRRSRAATAPVAPYALEGLSPAVRSAGSSDPRLDRFRARVGAVLRADGNADHPAGERPKGRAVAEGAHLHATLISEAVRRVAILVDGDEPGASGTVVELCRAAGRTGGRVVVLTGAGMTAGPTLADLLAGRAGFGDVIQRNPETLAHEIALGPISGGPSGLCPAELETVLAALESAYDLVVLSLGPPDADMPLALIGAAERIVLVGEGDDPWLRRARAMFAEAGLEAVTLSGRGAAA